MIDSTIEEELQKKYSVDPRVLPADIEANIIAEYYFLGSEAARVACVVKGRHTQQAQDALGCLTFCTLVLRNGFTVTGESACVSPNNFNDEIGRQIARQNAINKIWPLMGYELKSRLLYKTLSLENGSTLSSKQDTFA